MPSGMPIYNMESLPETEIIPRDDDYKGLSRMYAKKYGLDPDLFERQIGVESSFNPKALGPETKYGRAMGLGQLMPGTAKGLGVVDPFDVHQNLDGSARYMQQMTKRAGNQLRAMAAYLQGPGALDEMGVSGDGLDYIAKVTGPLNVRKFRELYPETKNLSDEDIAKRVYETDMKDSGVSYDEFRKKFIPPPIPQSLLGAGLASFGASSGELVKAMGPGGMARDLETANQQAGQEWGGTTGVPFTSPEVVEDMKRRQADFDVAGNKISELVNAVRYDPEILNTWYGKTAAGLGAVGPLIGLVSMAAFGNKKAAEALLQGKEAGWISSAVKAIPEAWSGLYWATTPVGETARYAIPFGALSFGKAAGIAKGLTKAGPGTLAAVAGAGASQASKYLPLPVMTIAYAQAKQGALDRFRETGLGPDDVRDIEYYARLEGLAGVVGALPIGGLFHKTNKWTGGRLMAFLKEGSKDAASFLAAGSTATAMSSMIDSMALGEVQDLQRVIKNVQDQAVPNVAIALILSAFSSKLGKRVMEAKKLGIDISDALPGTEKRGEISDITSKAKSEKTIASAVQQADEIIARGNLSEADTARVVELEQIVDLERQYLDSLENVDLPFGPQPDPGATRELFRKVGMELPPEREVPLGKETPGRVQARTLGPQGTIVPSASFDAEKAMEGDALPKTGGPPERQPATPYSGEVFEIQSRLAEDSGESLKTATPLAEKTPTQLRAEKASAKRREEWNRATTKVYKNAGGAKSAIDYWQRKNGWSLELDPETMMLRPKGGQEVPVVESAPPTPPQDRSTGEQTGVGEEGPSGATRAEIDQARENILNRSLGPMKDKTEEITGRSGQGGLEAGKLVGPFDTLSNAIDHQYDNEISGGAVKTAEGWFIDPKKRSGAFKVFTANPFAFPKESWMEETERDARGLYIPKNQDKFFEKFADKMAHASQDEISGKVLKPLVVYKSGDTEKFLSFKGGIDYASKGPVRKTRESITKFPYESWMADTERDSEGNYIPKDQEAFGKRYGDYLGRATLHQTRLGPKDYQKPIVLWKIRDTYTPLIFKKKPSIDLMTANPFYVSASDPSERWYSRMNMAIASDLPGKVSAQEFRSLMEKWSKGGKFKSEEWRDTQRLTGINKWLDEANKEYKGKIPKEKLVNEMIVQGIQVEEIVRGDFSGRPSIAPMGPDAPIHPERTLPGGYRYTEVILTSPQAGEIGVDDTTHFIEGKGKKQIGWFRGKWQRDASGEKVFNLDEVQSWRAQRAQEERERIVGEKAMELYDSDTSSKDIVEEKLRQGVYRKEANKLVPKDAGYRDAEKMKELEALSKRLYKMSTRDPAWDEINNQYLDLLDSLKETPGKVPEMPFQKSYTDLLARAVVKYVAERGGKTIAWTTGEQHAERSGLRQVADEMSYNKETGELQWWKDGREGGPRYFSQEELPRVVGPEMTERLLEAPAPARELDSIGLQRLNRVQVPESTELYLGKWPEKVYGMAGREVTYEKSILANALKEAVSPWKVEVGETQAKGFTGGKDKAYEIVDEILSEHRLRLDTLTDEEFNSLPDDVRNRFNEAYTELWHEEDSLREFSRQPSITMPDEAVKYFATNPMRLYTANPFAAFTEESAPKAKKELLRGVATDTPEGKIADAFVKQSVGAIGKIARIPHWLTKDKPVLQDIYNSVWNRVGKFIEGFDSSLRGIEKYKKLNPNPFGGPNDKQQAVAKVFFGWDGQAYSKQGITEPKFNELKNGDVELNPKHYEQYEKWARSKLDGDMAEALVDVRKSVDQDLVNRWNRTKARQDTSSPVLQEMRDEGNIDNYAPRTRYGDMVLAGYMPKPGGSYVKGEDGKFKYAGEQKGTHEKVVDHATSMHGLAEWRFKKYKAADVQKKLMNDPVVKALGPIEWEANRRVDIPGELLNQPLLIKALDEVVKSASDKATDPRVRAGIKAVLPDAIADTMKSLGAWGHFSKRRGIYGYEMEHLGKVLYDYKMGLYSALAKVDAAHEVSSLMYKIDKSDSRGLKWATQYIQDTLGPRNKIDSISDMFRAVAFAKYIGGSLSSPFVNLTNMINQGSPRLGVDIGSWKADRYLGRGIKEFGQYVIGRKTGKITLSPDKARLLEELFIDGTIQSQYINEMKIAFARQSAAGTGLAQIADWAARPMQLTEIMTRGSTALAAYDAFMDGKVKSKRALAKYGLEPGYKIDQNNITDDVYGKAKAFAEEVVTDSHQNYGKVNRPEWARSGRIGSALSGAYTFRHFALGTTELWGWMGKQGMHGNPSGYAALTRSIIGQMVFAGLAGIPGAMLLRKLYREYMPKEWRVMGDDPMIWMRDKMPKGIRDLATYGLPSALGFDVGGSIAIDAPTSFEELLGVPASMVKDIGKAVKAYDAKDYQRLAEIMVPLKLARDLLAQERLSREGATTLTGQPLALPGENEPMRLTGGERALKSVGFMPLRMRKMWDLREIGESMQSYKHSMTTKLADRWMVSRNNGDSSGQSEALEDLWAWNTFWIQKRRPHFVIDIRDALESRLKAQQPAKPMRLPAREMKEAMGF